MNVSPWKQRSSDGAYRVQNISVLLEYRGLKIIYRRYASLFFVVAVDGDEEVWRLRGFAFLIR